jgi:hypothetical protein
MWPRVALAAALLAGALVLLGAAAVRNVVREIDELEAFWQGRGRR